MGIGIIMRWECIRSGCRRWPVSWRTRRIRNSFLWVCLISICFLWVWLIPICFLSPPDPKVGRNIGTTKITTQSISNGNWSSFQKAISNISSAIVVIANRADISMPHTSFTPYFSLSGWGLTAKHWVMVFKHMASRLCACVRDCVHLCACVSVHLGVCLCALRRVFVCTRACVRVFVC